MSIGSSRPRSPAERLFALLLRLYPRSFRELHGSEMLGLFADLERDELERARRTASSGGVALAQARLLWRALTDGVSGAMRARRSETAWRDRCAATGRPARFGKEASLMTSIAHDFRYATRMLARSPGFTLLAAITLALGIGANTAIFSVVYGVLLRPLEVQDPSRLVVVNYYRASDPRDISGFAPDYLADLESLVEGEAGVRELSGFIYESVTLLGDGEPQELGMSLMVDGSFFRVVGVQPIAGRVLDDRDVLPNRRGNVCVISEALWLDRFGGDESILGQTLVLDGQPVTVVGVMPSSVPIPQIGVDLWMTQGWDVRDGALIGRLNAFARLEPGAPVAAAENRFAEAAARLGSESQRFAGYTIALSTLSDNLVGSARSAILSVAGAVAVILLIACVNLSGLLLARAATREHEMATRQAIGARRGQILSQLLAESLLLALLGGLLGVALAFGLHRLLLGLASGLVPRLYDVQLDLPVLGFALGISVLTGLVFGLAPALYTFTRSLTLGLRGGGSASAGRWGLYRARQLLVAGEIALAVILVAGASLMLRSLAELRAVDPGFRIAGVGGARIYLDDKAYSGDEAEAAYFRGLLEQVRSRPEITSAGASSGLPLDPQTIDYDLPYLLPGETVSEDEVRQAYFRTITPGYLETIGIPLLRGRMLAETDRADSEPVAVISETFARTAWPEADPVGESFAIYGGRRELRVVGVVGDVHFAGPADAHRAEFFVPYTQTTYGAMTVVARSGEAATAAEVVAREALALDPSQPVHSTLEMATLLRQSLSTNRFYTALLIAFAALALLLAGAGIYGVISYWVNQSRRELGLRMAVGASGRRIVELVLGRSLAVAALGLVAGLVLSLVGARALQQFLYQVEATDAGALTAVALVLLAVALFASLAPALRAGKISPMNTLRLE